MTTKELNAKAKAIREWFDSTCDINLREHRAALKRAAKMIHSQQTNEEQDAGRTIALNRIGYNGRDGDFGGRIANWRGDITLRMAAGAKKMLRKYAKQIAKMKLKQLAVEQGH
jgi:hypothetical protein